MSTYIFLPLLLQVLLTVVVYVALAIAKARALPLRDFWNENHLH